MYNFPTKLLSLRKPAKNHKVKIVKAVEQTKEPLLYATSTKKTAQDAV